MQRRILISFGLLGAIVGLVVLFLLLRTASPKLPMVETQSPPERTAPPPEPELRAIKQGGTIRGKVINKETRKPIPGATVIALRPYLDKQREGEDAPIWGGMIEATRVKTDKKGTFAIDDLPSDYWNLWVERRGYSWTTVPRAKFKESHVIELARACSVRGRVVYDDETPAADVKIEYTPQGTHSEVFARYRLSDYYTYTDKDGRFEYTDLPDGKFTIEVYPDEHLPAPWLYQSPLKPGENRDLGTHKLDGGFGMTVYVKWRGSNEPVEGVEVVVRPVVDPMPRTKTGRRKHTNSEGLARFGGLGGQVVDSPTFTVAANTSAGPVLPDSGGMIEPDQTVTIYLRRDGIIKGTVQRPSGEPLEHFYVEVRPKGFFSGQHHGFGEQGGFRLLGVPEGDYTLYVRYGNLVDKSVDVTAVAGKEIDVGVIRLDLGAQVHGTVRNANGSELEGIIRVHLARKRVNPRTGREGWEPVKRAYCKKDGSYVLKGVPAGRYWIWPENKSKASRTTDPVRVDMAPGTGVVQMDLTIHGEGLLKLKFFDEIEGTVREVVRPPTFLLEKSTGEEIRWMGEGTPLRAGSYDVSVELENEGGVPQRYSVQTVEIQESETTGPIEVRLHEISHGG